MCSGVNLSMAGVSINLDRLEKRGIKILKPVIKVNRVTSVSGDSGPWIFMKSINDIFRINSCWVFPEKRS